MLIQLLYISAHDGVAITDPAQFMANSKQRNIDAGLTSILLSTDEYFLHLIEGHRIDVNVLYNKINKDPKHTNCTILRYIEIKKREFEHWDAAYVNLSEFNIGGMNLLLPSGNINIETISATQAVTMIRRIHAHLLVKHEEITKKSVS